MHLLTATDQMGVEVKFQFPPRRIISLVPSQTEFLHSLGLDDEVVGITRFCIHPRAWHLTKNLIGGTKSFDLPLIESLQPDLIIGNKEENYAEGIGLLREKFPVWMSDIFTLDDAIEMMSSIGTLTNRNERAEEIVQTIRRNFNTLKPRTNPTVLYLIWRKPWMAAGRKTFIDDLLNRAGFDNVVADERYPVLDSRQISELDPDYIFLSSEPFPFTYKHVGELKVIAPRSRSLLVDGEMFSWYGSRLLLACDYLNSLTLNDVDTK
jgi:ABC-type Fe3+-hydroxamate transport system substrate-binding protein